MSNDKTKMIDVIESLLKTEAINNAPDADKASIDEAQKVLEELRNSPNGYEGTMNAYSYVDDNEVGPEFPVSFVANHTCATLNLGDDESGTRIMLEVRDSNIHGETGISELWVGFGSPENFDITTLVINLQNGVVTDFDPNPNEFNMSPLQGNSEQKPQP